MKKKKAEIAILPNCNQRSMEGIIGSLGRRKIPIVGLSKKPNCAAFHSRYVSKQLLSPDSMNENEYISFLINEVPRGVLFTADDQTALIFSRNNEVLCKNGFKLNLPDNHDLNVGFNKWLCFCHASKIGIPCAPTKLITGSESLISAPKEISFPLILKATTLSGGNYCKAENLNELFAAYKTMLKIINESVNSIMNPQIIAQQWLRYKIEDIWCVEAYYDQKGAAKGFWPVRKWRTVLYKQGTYGSRLYAGESRKNKRLESQSEKLLSSLHWKGFAHLDWVYVDEDDEYYLTEINPRLPGFSAFPTKAGFDMAFYYYSDLTGQPFDICRTKSHIYFEAIRYPGDLTEGIGAIYRKKYQWSKFLSTYMNLLAHKRPHIIDFADLSDPYMTLYNLKDVMSQIIHRLLKRA